MAVKESEHMVLDPEMRAPERPPVHETDVPAMLRQLERDMP